MFIKFSANFKNMIKKTMDNMGYILVGFSVAMLLLLIFIKSDIDKEQKVLCNTFAQYDLDMDNCPAHNNNTSWLLTLSFGVSFLLFGLGSYLSFVPIAKTAPEKKIEVDTSELDDDEKSVFGVIINGQGSVYQSDLIKHTGFSKVKITRILDRLENKGAVERKRRGMTNLIVVK